MTTTTKARRLTGIATTVLAASALFTGLSMGSGASAASAAPAVPTFDFSACPDLPEGADPSLWRCEEMVTVGGHLTMGRIDQPLAEPMRITFAEGRIDGVFHQVFGAMEAEPMPVRGVWPGLTITPTYAGYSDFLSNDERRGEIDLTYTVTGAGLPRSCAVGPVHLVLKDTKPTEVVSPDPLVVTFGVEDTGFAVPGTTGCGPLGTLLDRRLGLPAGSGASSIELDAYVGILSYEQLDES